MRRKKIIEIIPKFKLAGAETMCENLIFSYDRNKYDVIIISFFNYKSAITKRLEENKYKIYYLNKKQGFDIGIIRKLYKIFKREQPDMIHTHLYVLRYVIFPAKLACANAKIVHTVHNIASKEIKKGKWIHRFAFKKLNVTPVAISEIVKDSILVEYKLEDSKVPIIYNGIDLSRCNQKKKYNDSKIILHIGRFSEQKNHEELIEIFEKCLTTDPNLKLYLVGEGELEEKIKAIVESKKIQNNIFFLGALDNCYSVMNEADMFIMPSKWEGMPMTIIEAMGTGLPVIAYPVGGIPNMIKDGKNGFLASDIDDFCSKILELEKSKSLRMKIGQNNINDSRKFSSQVMGELYCKLLEKE